MIGGKQMRGLMLSACTGNGHNAVMESIYSFFNTEKNIVQCFPDFYESIMASNKIMSDFYNLLQITSFELCSIYTQMSILRNTDSLERDYEAWKTPLKAFLDSNPCDIIISTTPLINYFMLKYLKERKSSIKYYIIVTDPFKPIYPGFDRIGANGYFVPNLSVRNILTDSGIEKERIKICGYPLRKSFINYKCKKIPDHLKQYDANKKTILINCGAQGSFHYIKIVESLLNAYQYNYNILVICGKNKALFNLLSKKNGASIIGYCENMRAILEISDICICKAGANTFFECLYTKTPVLIDATKGFLYQEKGVVEYLGKNQVGEIFRNLNELVIKAKYMLRDEKLFYYRENCGILELKNGGEAIASAIGL